MYHEKAQFLLQGRKKERGAGEEREGGRKNQEKKKD